MTPPRILVADDQPGVLEALRLLLKSEGFETETVGSPAAALKTIESREFDVVLIDLNYARDTTSGREGLDLLGRIAAVDADLPVVVMTAWASVDLAVEAMRRGARDFVEKPWNNARLMAIVRTQVELGHALKRGRRLETENRALRGDNVDLVAESTAMRAVADLVNRVGPSDASILITGENGAGKGTIARALHAVSPRAGKPLVMVNAAGLSEGVFESELFGHVRGAFTDAKSDRAGRFELADGGTLFLDEIASVPTPLQAKLLRVIETGEFEPVGSSRTKRADVRLLSATNADLDAEVRSLRFRQDLLFRLNTIEIRLPPLRERREDIPVLAGKFLDGIARRYRKRLVGFDAAAMRALMEHTWPGNVRELEHAVERAALLATGERIGASDLLLRPSGETPRLEDLSLEEVECFLVKKALERHQGNVSRAAETLGLSRSALYRRMERYGL